MKRILLGATAIAALIVPGAASADVRGAIDFSFENTDYSPFNYDADVYTLGGGVTADVSQGIVAQLDAHTSLIEGSGGGASTEGSYAAAHLSTSLGGLDVGGYGGIVSFFGDSGVLFGVEARTDWNQFSFHGSISSVDFGDAGYDVSEIRIGGAYFFSPNFALNADYAQAEFNNFGADTTGEWSVGAAYQFSNNVELFGSWTKMDADYVGPGGFETEGLQLGIRLNLGGGTLQENTNDGLWTSARDFSDALIRY